MVFSMCLPRYFLEEQAFCHNHSLSLSIYALELVWAEFRFEHCWHLAESLRMRMRIYLLHKCLAMPYKGLPFVLLYMGP